MKTEPQAPKLLVVCGPTASGKSLLVDHIGSLSDGSMVPSKTVLLDSMQVYREIPVTSNQARTRPACMVGAVSVFDEWSVAHQKEATYGIIRSSPPEAPVLIEAGTGMYLNAVVFDTPLADKVPDHVRREAERRVLTARSLMARSRSKTLNNPRRAVREEELRIMGLPERGSIWDGNLAFETAFVYLRPEREDLDRAISERSSFLCSDGLEEVAHIISTRESDSLEVSRTVMGSIGVRELTSVIKNEMKPREAEERISTRTRQLARRQIRWFDKLMLNTRNDPNLHSVGILRNRFDHDNEENSNRNTIHKLGGTIAWWMD